jgi:DNA replication protein DnaC
MSQESNRLLLKHHLEKLRLPTMRRDWERLAASCAKEGRDHAEYLWQLCERELIEREQRAAARRVKNAKFPVTKTLDGFDFKAQPTINETLVRQLSTCDYLKEHDNVLLLGNSGTGKSHLATALGFAACTQGKRVRFWTACALVTHLLELRERRDLQQFQAQWEKHDLIILDELGYVPFSKEGAELLFEVVSRAYERVSLIVTTNLPFEQWSEVMGSERLTGAMLDRITHRVHIIEANGESYRLRDAQKRRSRKA